MHHARQSLALVGLLVLLGSGGSQGCDRHACDREAIQARLDAASPGDVVEIGECRVEGSLHVPAGVTLAGVGSNRSAIEALPGSLVAVEADSVEGLRTVVRGVGLSGPAEVSLRVEGDGEVELSDLDIDIDVGVGIGVIGVSSLTMNGVVVQGPVDEGSRDDPSLVSATAEDSVLVGVSLDGVATARLEEVAIHGVARIALGVRGGRTNVVGGEISGNLGYGIVAQDATLVLEEATLRETWQGLRGEPSMALALSNVELSTADLVLASNDRYGVVHTGGTARHQRFDASDHGDAALWMGSLASAELIAGSIADGVFAGLVMVDVATATVENVDVSGIQSQRRNIGSGGVTADIRVGDGLHLVGTPAILTSVTATANERAGLVVDLEPSLSFIDVVVDASGDGLGAVGGNVAPGDPFVLETVAPAGWDAGIERRGAAVANDSAIVGEALDVVGAGLPSELPPTE